MVLTLYGNANSTCTKRVANVLHYKQVPFEFVSIDFAKGEHKSPEFLKKQPFGQVPYVDDDGFIIYESRAIARYIAEKYAGQGRELIPKDLKKKALFEQAASVEGSNFDPYASGIVYEKIFKGFHGQQTNEETVKAHTEKLEAKLAVYDSILANQKYLAGDELTLADLFHLPYGALLPASGNNSIDKFPNVKRWWDDLTSQPSWKAIAGGVSSVAAY
ncbi:glutathione S-transferase [Coprinopsis marcescibilis]|uniref:glutathione transferase n=1 Tax=Coprinopsis marcescibilis TaxID=230819 RepID=A0A5C3L5H3_COPMA|nr:glutathione S-transferase [Coprinopsis marcescibilis]